MSNVIDAAGHFRQKNHQDRLREIQKICAEEKASSDETAQWTRAFMMITATEDERQKMLAQEHEDLITLLEKNLYADEDGMRYVGVKGSRGLFHTARALIDLVKRQGEPVTLLVGVQIESKHYKPQPFDILIHPDDQDITADKISQLFHIHEFQEVLTHSETLAGRTELLDRGLDTDTILRCSLRYYCPLPRDPGVK
ncbi:MAG: hypothetical protein H6867_01445 [Rhodospirillales bacterium]|nr:hypothetical protein [Rhodospirillales bacterium]MCB9997181.1 hypothetical protein [Rhodospirillales bacterium]